MIDVVIVSAARTAIGSFGGSLAAIPAVELGRYSAQAAMERAGIEADLIDEVYFGHVLQAGQGQNSARQVSVNSKIPVEVPATTINIVCGSGLKSVILGAQTIRSGDAQTILTGGMENMSMAPYLLDKARWGYRMGDGTLKDSIISEGLSCAFNHYHMGITAENVAERYHISRERQDAFALLSQQRALKALDDNVFSNEIVPITVQNKKNQLIVDRDEHPHKGINLEALAKLKPAFKQDGTVTAGNASGLNDGAAALILMDYEKAKTLGIKPMARIRSYATSGVDPAFMGIGPVPATRKALANAGLSIDDIDLIEANEAFAAQFLAVGQELKLLEEKTNIYGGAIALGHPIGASGARILVTLLHALIRKDKTLGLATLCIGGGMGVSLIIERI